MTVTPAVPDLPETTAYSSPVPRELVHKAAHSEVLLTGWRRLGKREFEVGAQWPRDHGFWHTGADGVQDPMLLVETTRQVLPLLSHAAYGLPRDHRLLWVHYDCSFTAPLLSVTGRPAEVLVRVRASQAPAHGRRLRRLGLTMEVTCEGRVLGIAHTAFSAHSPAVYARLRGPGRSLAEEAMAAALPPAAPPLEAARVGRERGGDVLLAPGPDAGNRLLRVPTSSPWLFDHPVDHVPGMLLMEAARQCGRLTLPPHQAEGTQLVRIGAEFHRYVDLDEPATVTCEPPPAVEAAAASREEHTTVVEVVQRDVPAFRAVVGFAAHAAGTGR